jgi:hypothetical protein
VEGNNSFENELKQKKKMGDRERGKSESIEGSSFTENRNLVQLLEGTGQRGKEEAGEATIHFESTSFLLGNVLFRLRLDFLPVNGVRTSANSSKPRDRGEKTYS